MKSLRDRVAQIYYTHGLFCASHPFPTILGVVCAAFVICYPLTNLPLPGNTPLQFAMPLNEYIEPPHVSSTPSVEDEQKKPRWIVGDPVGYVQQIVVKAAVSPWQPQQLIPTDAFRSPLSKVYEILEHIDHIQFSENGKNYALSDICLRVAETVSWRKVKHIFPEYSCLIVSPANMWHRDKTRFDEDPEIIKTVYRPYQQALETPPTVKEILFGLPWKQTGISRYFIRNRQRTISYAVTIVTKTYNPRFIQALKNKLEELYPETSQNVNNTEIDFMIHMHYKDINYFVEYTPLLVTYFVLLLYLYFSVRKIEMVKSKWGLAISAVMTVVASLLMSVSICTVSGLTPTLNGGEIFPYLVVLIGVENVLVVTKSVVSTPVHLDVKIRVAQGLSREGWSITKNLVTELLIILVGFFTFVPAIREFCMFALVGLLSDFFLQMMFFVTVLSVDIRRMELADLHKQSVQQAVQDDQYMKIEPLLCCPVMSRMPAPTAPPPSKIHRSKSAPKLCVQNTGQQRPPSPPPSPLGQSVDVFFPTHDILELHVPRRLRFFYFWARTRIFQRLIMFFTVVWIALIFYKTGLVDKLTSPEDGVLPTTATVGPSGFDHVVKGDPYVDKGPMKAVEEAIGATGRGYEEEEQVGPLEHTNLEQWRQLSYKHWPRLFGYYNISLAGRYITILPVIHLSILISPDTAISLRHHAEKSYYTIPMDKDPLEKEANSSESYDFTSRFPPNMYNPEHLKQFYPKSRKEFIATLCLAILSVIIISYFMVVLYKCMCSRNYSKWRSSWSKVRKRRRGYYKQIKETVPLVLKGHKQMIDCLVADGPLIVSCCWGGQLRVWDSNTGECISSVCRKSITPPQRRRPCVGRNVEDNDADLYAEYHGENNSPPNSESPDLSELRRAVNQTKNRQSFTEINPDLKSTINTDFLTIEPRFSSTSSPSSSVSTPGFDFRGWFEGVYEEHRRQLAETESSLRDHRLHSAGDGQQMVASEEQSRNRSWSAGDTSSMDLLDENSTYDPAADIWSLACQDGFVVAGCRNGRIEIWEAETGVLKGQYDGCGVAVMGLCFTGRRVVAGRLDGSIDFFDLELFQNQVVISPVPPSTASTSRPVRGHVRHFSSGSNFTGDIKLWETTINCTCIQSCRAHQRPINVLKSEGGRVVSGSQDHTLKVFRQEDCLCLYTLHGHTGSVTALCLDKLPPYAAASGSADGVVRLWDLLSGTCVHKFKGHNGTIASLTCTVNYVVSLGLDDRLCIWERSRGHLLHSLNMEQCYNSCLALLTNNLLVTGGQGKLLLWDLTKGELVRRVNLDDSEQAAFVSHLQVVGNMGVACDSGTDIKVVHFPTILEKAE